MRSQAADRLSCLAWQEPLSPPCLKDPQLRRAACAGASCLMLAGTGEQIWAPSRAMKALCPFPGGLTRIGQLQQSG